MMFKNKFHHWTSELPAKWHSQFILDRSNLQHWPAGIFKVNGENHFWCLFCLHMNIEIQKIALLNLFHFTWVSAAYQLYMFIYRFGEVIWWMCFACMLEISTLLCLKWSMNCLILTKFPNQKFSPKISN